MSRKGQKNTPEHNAKISAAHLGKKLSPEHAEKARNASLGRKQTPEEIERRRVANTGKKRSSAFCEQMRQLQANQTPEQKAARAEATRQRNLNRDPAQKEAMRQTLIARNKSRAGEKRIFPPVRSVGSADPIFYVYEHWRTDRGECFYVGKGFGRRAYDMSRGRNAWHRFLQAKLSALGTAIEVRIVADGLSEREAFDFEVERIAFWKNDGADLVNLTLGGDGPSGRKHTEEWKRANGERMRGTKMSDESRAKLSASMKGNKNGLGKKKPQHVIDKVAAANRGKKRTPEMNAHMSAVRKANPTFLGKTHSAEWRKMMSESQKGIPKPESTKQSMRGKPKSEEHKQKLRAANLGKKCSEEMRKKISEKTKEGLERRKLMLLETEKLQGNQ
jgi:hypothetical protein